MKIAFFLSAVYAINKAILVNLSTGYYNYRHMTNIQVFYKVLVDNGFKPSDIEILFGDDPIQNKRNPCLNKIYLSENEEHPYVKFNPKPISLNFMLNILELRTKNLFRLDENDNVLLYMCGHGRDGFIKVMNREFLYKEDIMEKIRYICSRIKNLLVILDTCQAESLLDINNIPENATIITTSLKDEYSYASNLVTRIGMNTIDDFVYVFYKTISSSINLSILDFFEKLNNRGLKSHINCYGKFNLPIREFFVQNNEEKQLKKFKF